MTTALIVEVYLPVKTITPPRIFKLVGNKVPFFLLYSLLSLSFPFSFMLFHSDIAKANLMHLVEARRGTGQHLWASAMWVLLWNLLLLTETNAHSSSSLFLLFIWLFPLFPDSVIHSLSAERKMPHEAITSCRSAHLPEDHLNLVWLIYINTLPLKK